MRSFIGHTIQTGEDLLASHEIDEKRGLYWACFTTSEHWHDLYLDPSLIWNSLYTEKAGAESEIETPEDQVLEITIPLAIYLARQQGTKGVRLMTYCEHEGQYVTLKEFPV